LTRCCFLFKSLGQEFVVLSLWGALSDERPGLSFVSQSHFTAYSQSVSQSISQYALVSSPLRGRLTSYCFLFKSLGLEFVVLSLWGTLSDERPGLHSQSHFMADSQYLLVSSTLRWRLTRYCFLFRSLGLEFVVLSLWGALSDERPGLSFVSHSLVIRLCVRDVGGEMKGLIAVSFLHSLTYSILAARYWFINHSDISCSTRHTFYWRQIWLEPPGAVRQLRTREIVMWLPFGPATHKPWINDFQAMKNHATYSLQQGIFFSPQF
jgi:hypothetical protein